MRHGRNKRTVIVDFNGHKKKPFLSRPLKRIGLEYRIFHKMEGHSEIKYRENGGRLMYVMDGDGWFLHIEGKDPVPLTPGFTVKIPDDTWYYLSPGRCRLRAVLRDCA